MLHISLTWYIQPTYTFVSAILSNHIFANQCNVSCYIDETGVEFINVGVL